MAYEKQTWVTGDVITEEKLNHMEDGIADAQGGSGPFIVNVDTTSVTANDTTTYTVTSCSATYSEIKSAYDSGRLCEARILVGGQAYPGAPRTNTIIPLSSVDDLAGIIQFDRTHANLYKQLVIRKSGSPTTTYQQNNWHTGET